MVFVSLHDTGFIEVNVYIIRNM